MDTTLADPLLGQLIDGRYRVVSRIARGGMATVYVATDTRLDRTVALKLMHPELCDDEDFVRRFIGEARSVAQLSHPNIVSVYDQGADGNRLYLTMEHVPGRTLRDLLHDRNRLAPPEALDVVLPILDALAAAHHAGIVHRDVKPENVLIGQNRRIKVVDFGLARAVSGVSHTKTGVVIGTVAYLAPEQISRSSADARTDVYAVGVMLFELLTGRQPHEGETPLAVASKHVNEAVPAPSSIAPGIPPALDALVTLATSRDPELRPADAGQFLHAALQARHAVAPTSTGRHAAPPRAEVAGAAPGLGAPLPAGSPPPGPLPLGSPPPGPFPAGSPPPGPFPAGSPPPGVLAAGIAAQAHPGAPVRTGPPHGQPPGPPHGPAHGAPTGAPRPALTGPGGTHGPPHVPAGGGQPGHRPGMPPGAPPPGAAPAGPRPHPPAPPAANHTLVVDRGALLPAGAVPPPAGGGGLGGWVFGRPMLYAALALVVLLALGTGGWWFLSGRYTSVPDVSGQTVKAATLQLEALGFTVTRGPAVFHDEVKKGLVVSTDPAPDDRVLRNAELRLITSKGPELFSVPEVAGKTVPEAQELIRAAKLQPGATKKGFSFTAPRGSVLGTEPKAYTMWPKTKPVDIVVCEGIELPDFVGKPKPEAEAWLGQYGVKVNVQIVAGDKPRDVVVQQEPRPHNGVVNGETVTLYVSQGPPMVPIPDIRDWAVEDAVRALQELEFEVQVIGDGERVLLWTPSGEAPKGSQIRIFTRPGD